MALRELAAAAVSLLLALAPLSAAAQLRPLDPFEWRDVMPYAMVAEWSSGSVQPRVVVVGDLLGPSGRELRGNEPHGELRLGLRSGGRTWLRAELIRGYREFSPDWGVSAVVGGSW